MATIKSYSDLEQSKKLAQILPLETADMYYPWYIEDDGDTIESGHRINTPDIGNFITHKVNKMILPCWSLAALLDILSKTAHSIDEDGSVDLGDYKNIEWSVCLNNTNVGLFTADNHVDACVGIIMRLHELKWI